MPEARSLLEATVEAGNLARAAQARELYQVRARYQFVYLHLYKEGMEEVAGGSQPYLNPATLEEEHQRLVAAALHLYTAGKPL